MQTNPILRLCLQHISFKVRLGIASEVKHATGYQGVLNLSTDFVIVSPEAVKHDLKSDH